MSEFLGLINLKWQSNGTFSNSYYACCRFSSLPNCLPKAVGREKGRERFARKIETDNEIVHVIKSLKNTELFDLLVADNESKQNWVRAVVERNFEKEQPEAADDEVDMVDYSSVISDFLPE